MTISRTINGTCHHDCPDSCGWTATVDGDGADAVAVKLRGNPAHPFSAGELCPKVNRFLDRVYSPDRVLTPLRRTGPKGSGEFEPISWADALAETVARLHGVIATHGPEAVLPFSDAGNQSLLSLMGLSGRFFGHMGASLIDRNICGPTVGAGMRMTNGTGRGMDALELNIRSSSCCGAPTRDSPTATCGRRSRRPAPAGAARGDRPDPHPHRRGHRSDRATGSSSRSPAPTSR